MEYRSKYLSMADTIAYQEEVNKLKSSQMLYELDQSAFTIKSLNDEMETQRKVTAVVTVAAVLCGLMLIVLVRQNKKLRNAWTALYERNSRHLLDEIKYKKTIREYQKAIREINEPSVPEIPPLQNRKWPAASPGKTRPHARQYSTLRQERESPLT